MREVPSPGASWDALPDADAARIVHWFEWVWNRGEERVIPLLFHTDGLAWGIGDRPLRGPAEFLSFHRTFHRNFAPLTARVDQAFEADGMVTARASLTLTIGEQQVESAGIAVCRFVDGKMAEAWNAWDFLPIFLASGLLLTEDVQRVFGAPEPEQDPTIPAD